MVAQPKLNQINGGIVGDFSMLLSNNAKTGGTCFGDSGGPNFSGDSNVIAAVTSFGINGNCAGTGGVFRLDRAKCSPSSTASSLTPVSQRTKAGSTRRAALRGPPSFERCRVGSRRMAKPHDA